MRLLRHGNAELEKDMDSISMLPDEAGQTDPDRFCIVEQFRSFGLGTDRTSDFQVSVSWIDVRDFLQMFAKIKHPEAIRIQAALAILSEIENLGWRHADVDLSSGD